MVLHLMENTAPQVLCHRIERSYVIGSKSHHIHTTIRHLPRRRSNIPIYSRRGTLSEVVVWSEAEAPVLRDICDATGIAAGLDF
jgi:hypothetical protein